MGKITFRFQCFNHVSNMLFRSRFTLTGREYVAILKANKEFSF